MGPPSVSIQRASNSRSASASCGNAAARAAMAAEKLGAMSVSRMKDIASGPARKRSRAASSGKIWANRLRGSQRSSTLPMSKTTSMSERPRQRVRADAPVRPVERGDGGAVAGVERETEDVEVFRQPFAPRRLRDGDQPLVEMPADDDLRRRAAMLGGELAQHGIVELPPAPERRPRFGGDALAGVEGAQFALLEARMQFDLVERRLDASVADDALQVLAGEIGDADRSRQPLLAQPDQRPPAICVESAPRRRPMYEIEIDIVEVEAAQAFATGAQCGVEALRVVPEFGCDEHVLARRAGVDEPEADAGLVAVDRRRIEMTVAGLQRRGDDVGGAGGRRLPEAEAELRDDAAVVEGDLHRGVLCEAFVPLVVKGFTTKDTRKTPSSRRAAPHVRRRRLVDEAGDRRLEAERALRVRSEPAHRDGALRSLAFADGDDDRGLGQRMLAHLVADLLVGEIGLDAKPRLARRGDELQRVIVAVLGDGADDDLHRGEP